MGTTPALKLPFPNLTETADGPDAFSDLAQAVENYVYNRILPTGITSSPGHYWGSGGTYPPAAGLKPGDSFIHSTAGLQFWNGSNWSTLMTLDRLRLISTGDAAPDSTGHALQIGADNNLNVIFDNNEVVARNNGALAGWGVSCTTFAIGGAGTIGVQGTGANAIVRKDYVDGRIGSGTANITTPNAGTLATATIGFGRTFSAVPDVVAVLGTTSADYLWTLWVTAITTTNFSVRIQWTDRASVSPASGTIAIRWVAMN